MRLMMMFVALLVAAPAHASLAVALCTPARCVLASDSRVWDTLCDCPAGDIATKIHVRGAYGVVVTHDPAPLWAWQNLPLVAGESAAALCERIVDAVPHGPRAGESTIAVVRVAPFDAVVRHVRFEPDGRLDVIREAHPTLPVALVVGWPFTTDDEMAAIVQGLTAELRTQPSEPRMIAMAREILALGARRSPKIGGPVNLAVLDARASGGPVAWNGVGFWLDATSTPTFRVGNPSGNQLKWDGTNLTIGQGTVSIDSTGIHITPTDASDFTTTTDYGFIVSGGSLGYGGNDGSTNGRYLFAESAWTGACTGGRCNAAVVLDARADTGGTVATRGSATFDLAAVANSTAQATLTIALPGGTTYGEFDLFAYLDFRPDGTTNAAAGSNTLPANPCGFIIAGYQGSPIRIPFYAPNGGSCPTVP